MPVDSNIPTLIDPTQFSRALGLASDNPPFSFTVGGAIYLVFGDDQVAAPYFLTIYKSTDNGVTWTTPDSGNRPLLAVVPNPLGSCCIFGGIIYTAFESATEGGQSLICLCAFDTGSDTYANSNIDPTVMSLVVLSFSLNVRSTGELVFTYSEGSDAPFQVVKYSLFSLGVWSDPVILSTDIPDSTRSEVKGVYVHSDDSIHVFYDAPFFTGRPLNYISIDPSNVVGPIVLVEELAAFFGEEWGTILAVGGKLIFTAGFSIAGNLTPCFWESDAIPATAFTRIDIDESEICTGPVTTVLNGGIYYIFYISTLFNGSFTAVIQDQIRFFTTTDFVTFTGPTVYYDRLIDGPVTPTPGVDQFLHTMSLIGPGPNFSVAMALEFTPYCAGYFLAGGPAPPPPVVVPRSSQGGGSGPAKGQPPSFVICGGTASPLTIGPPSNLQPRPTAQRKGKSSATSFTVCRTASGALIPKGFDS